MPRSGRQFDSALRRCAHCHSPRPCHEEEWPEPIGEDHERGIAMPSRMVELKGLEPLASSMPWKRSTS